MKYTKLVRRENPYHSLGIIVVDGKTIQVQDLSPKYLEMALPHIRNLSHIENLPAHPKSVEIRLS